MKHPVFNQLWPDDVKAVFKHDMEQTWDSSLAPHLFNEYRYFLDIYQGYANTGEKLKILDVGCAQGTLSLLLAEQGHQLVALDIRQGFLDYAASRYEKGDIRFVCGNALDVVLDEQFDLVFANQIVEHLLYPVDMVIKLMQWVRTGGRLVMTTPNAEYIKNNLPTFSELHPVEQYLHLQHTADGDGHFFAYTPAEMGQVFIEAGVSDIEIHRIETPWISGHMKFRYLHGWTPYKVLYLMDQVIRLIPFFHNKFSYQILATGRRSS